MDPVVCNPVDLPYAYSYQQVQGYPSMVWREGADPSLIRYRDRYYLFVSMSGGFWHSDDLASWKFVPTPDLPILDYAPDVREIDGALVFSASKYDQPCSFWRTTDPLSGVFEELPGTFPFWDPNLFQDDDGRVYLYWGCSNETPIHGVELDRTTFRPLGDTVDLIHGDHMGHGWEWKGPGDGVVAPEAVTTESGKDPRPFVEGAWMTKFARHLLPPVRRPGDRAQHLRRRLLHRQLATRSVHVLARQPVLVGARWVRARGGTWQHRGGPVRELVARRHHPDLGRSRLRTTHRHLPGRLRRRRRPVLQPGVRRPPDRHSPTQGRPVDRGADRLAPPVVPASGRRDVVARRASPAEAVVDENIRSAWVAANVGPGEGVTIDIGVGCTVRAVQVNLADHDVTSVAPPQRDLDPDEFARRDLSTIDHPVPYQVDVSDDGVTWERVGNEGGADTPHRLLLLDGATIGRYVRVSGGPGAWGSAFALSGVRVFGERAGSAPAAADVSALRLDDRTARVSWTGTIGADGVNVRYGRTPDKLYHSWLVYGRDDLLISTLSAGVDYWVAVDAFNGSGLTRGLAVPIRRSGSPLI